VSGVKGAVAVSLHRPNSLLTAPTRLLRPLPKRRGMIIRCRNQYQCTLFLLSSAIEYYTLPPLRDRRDMRLHQLANRDFGRFRQGIVAARHCTLAESQQRGRVLQTSQPETIGVQFPQRVHSFL